MIANESTLAPADRLNEMLLRETCMDAGFRGLARGEPLALSPRIYEGFGERYDAIKLFQETVVELCHRSLEGEAPPEIAALLLNEIIPPFHSDFHRAIFRRRRDSPAFFRTDEGVPGKITEIQCPGSGWGECAVLIDYYAQQGFPAHRLPRFAEQFARDTNGLFGSAGAVVHYLLDNSALPNTLTYFIQQTRRHGLRHYGFERTLRPRDANFIRSHTFFGLVAECNFAERLERYFDGRLLFDLPPTMLFDQKMSLMLPFWSQTGRYFPDSVRALFPYTSLLTPEGLALPEGEAIEPAGFAARPKSERAYYLKYAGHDIPLHLEGRGVYFLGDMGPAECQACLEEAGRDYARGKYWLLQESVRTEASTELNGDSPFLLDTKYSAYYGPSGLLCIDVMQDRGAILRQGSGTLIGICIGGPGSLP